MKQEIKRNVGEFEFVIWKDESYNRVHCMSSFVNGKEYSAQTSMVAVSLNQLDELAIWQLIKQTIEFMIKMNRQLEEYYK